MITNKQLGTLLGTIFATSTINDDRYDTVVVLLDRLVNGKMSDKERSEAVSEMINSILKVIVGESTEQMIILDNLCEMMKSTCTSIVTRAETEIDWVRSLSNTLGQTVAEMQYLVTAPDEEESSPEVTASSPQIAVKKSPINPDKVLN